MRYLIGMIVICLFMSGCGRFSKPKLPENSFYPHSYFVQFDNQQDVSRQIDAEDVKLLDSIEEDVDLDLETQLYNVKTIR